MGSASQEGPESPDVPQRASVVINESAMRRLGFSSPDTAVGNALRAELFRVHDLTIVGVVQDVYFCSIKFGIRPTVYLNHPGLMQVATINYAPGRSADIINGVEAVWKRIVPNAPVSHQFLPDMIRAQYQAEEEQASVLAVFLVLAVVIASLGLHGLASFTAERRIREIGIRKVMGARVQDILRLLVWQFSLLVLVANLIAWPAAWIFLNRWLDGFQYRIDDVYILLDCLVIGTSALAIAWLTVAGRAYGVAVENPITALRHE